jgi:hypothetical protein
VLLPNYSSFDTRAKELLIDIRISYPSDIGFLRLDFETFTLLGTGNTMEYNPASNLAGGLCLDSFTVTLMAASSTVWFH